MWNISLRKTSWLLYIPLCPIPKNVLASVYPTLSYPRKRPDFCISQLVLFQKTSVLLHIPPCLIPENVLTSAYPNLSYPWKTSRLCYVLSPLTPMMISENSQMFHSILSVIPSPSTPTICPFFFFPPAIASHEATSATRSPFIYFSEILLLHPDVFPIRVFRLCTRENARVVQRGPRISRSAREGRLFSLSAKWIRTRSSKAAD